MTTPEMIGWADAFKRAATSFGEETAKSKLLRWLSEGVIHVEAANERCGKVSKNYFHAAPDANNGFSEPPTQSLIDAVIPFVGRTDFDLLGGRTYDDSFKWHLPFDQADGFHHQLDWIEVRSDWEAGVFQYAMILHDGLIEVASMGAIRFDRETFSALVPSRPHDDGGQKIGRRSSFDWEAAFADVAADLYHNLDFADVNARGVQSAIIAALRRSFERRNLPIPSDETLKPKARMIVGALRAKG